MTMASNLPHELNALQALRGDQVLGLPSDLLDLLPIGVYVCDTEGGIVRYNRTAAELGRRKPRRPDGQVLLRPTFSRRPRSTIERRPPSARQRQAKVVPQESC